ncbi:SERTA domain-containing protein 3 isoform X2 [Sphaeramia orbicularis]|uniref:SERTA domain-containing protein 3 isoform X2 n=1 Tax=Sphaeramia orbicularis TaxID=375764 RepID=UPI001180E953|nr:SERTA domain-containing protein 2-like isoform X2 [Sphaeramia orbicularis]
MLCTRRSYMCFFKAPWVKPSSGSLNFTVNCIMLWIYCRTSHILKMIMKGQKRKLPPEDVEVSDRTSLAWESQRQFVFSVSLSKYQRGQELPEPSLRRSVLIANTLRQISLEPCRAPPVDMELSLQSLPCSSTSTVQAKEWDNTHGGTVTMQNNHLTLASPPLVSSCSSPAISSILSSLDSTIDGSSQTAARTPLRALENLSDGGVSALKQGLRWSGGNWEQPEECRARENISVEAMRSSYLGDLTVDDLFQDIDTSLLERDMGGMWRGSADGHSAGDDLLRYLPSFTSSQSFSLSLNQKCLPSFSSFSPSSSSLSLPLPTPSLFSNPSLMRDGLELDHLMEILVES